MKFSSLLHCKNHVHYANIPVLKEMRVKSKSKGSLRFVVESLWELRVVGEIHEEKKKLCFLDYCNSLWEKAAAQSRVDSSICWRFPPLHNDFIKHFNVVSKPEGHLGSKC